LDRNFTVFPSKVTFHNDLLSGSAVVACGQTDMVKATDPNFEVFLRKHQLEGKIKRGRNDERGRR
jgi:hypothetical protein